MSKIEALHIYPIKSCAGTEVTSAALNEYGFIHDRKWMIVNDKGIMLTQRFYPEMALIKPTLTDGGIHIAHPDAGTIHIDETALDNTHEVKIWADTVSAKRANAFTSEWLSSLFKSQTPLHLVQYDSSQIRQPGQVERFGETAKHFTDAAPLLVCNEASLKALNTHLAEQNIEPMTMAHFRPNIVVSGLTPFQEHEINEVHADAIALKFIDHCSRCVMITVDPAKGEKRKDGTPFKALARLNAMPENANAPAFGVNVVSVLPQDKQSATLHKGQNISVN